METYIKSKIEGLEDHIKTQANTIKEYRSTIDKKDVLIDKLLKEAAKKDDLINSLLKDLLEKVSDNIIQIVKKL